MSMAVLCTHYLAICDSVKKMIALKGPGQQEVELNTQERAKFF